MELSDSYLLLLCSSLCLMLAQLMVKQKQTVHILFAIFCGSIAMMAAQKLSVEPLGRYHYLIGIGACATCNMSWLVARALFRKEKSIALPHIVLACSVAVLLIAKQILNFYAASSPAVTPLLLPAFQTLVQHSLSLLSSAVLVLAFWEGCNSWSKASPKDKQQRGLYLASFGLSVSFLLVIAPALPQELVGDNFRAWAACYIALFMIFIAQFIIVWRIHWLPSDKVSDNMKKDSPPPLVKDEDQVLAVQLHAYLVEQKNYLQTNLKVADVAHALGVSEYRIGRALNHHLGASNFNQYINQYRVEHAKSLLNDADKSHWSVLVVGLESGFASVGPFTRSFKKTMGCTPGQYRKSLG